MNVIFSAILGCLVGVGGTYWALVGFPTDLVEFAMLIILCIAGFYLVTKKSRFAGYVCEICGAEYNECEHKSLEDYTLVKKM